MKNGEEEENFYWLCGLQFTNVEEKGECVNLNMAVILDTSATFSLFMNEALLTDVGTTEKPI